MISSVSKLYTFSPKLSQSKSLKTPGKTYLSSYLTIKKSDDQTPAHLRKIIDISANNDTKDIRNDLNQQFTYDQETCSNIVDKPVLITSNSRDTSLFVKHFLQNNNITESTFKADNFAFISSALEE